LKLPDDLKRRIIRLAASAGVTTHAYMIDALAREAERAELRARLATEPAESERETLASGKAHSLETAFTYLEARIAGKRSRQPRARAWRASK